MSCDRYAPTSSAYDPIATLFDPWSRSVIEDIAFYVERRARPQARRRRPGRPSSSSASAPAGSPCPIAAAGIRVIGVDGSAGMLASAARRAARGRRRRPASTCGSATCAARPSTERVPLVIVPFRAYLHLPTTTRSALARLRAARELLAAGRPARLRRVRAGAGRHRGDARPLARARAGHLGAGGLGRGGAHADARVRGDGGETAMELAWLSDRRVARAARASRLRDRGLLRLVRPPPVHRRRGLGLGRAPTR